MSKQDYVETEIKLYVPDLSVVASRLIEVGARLTVPRIYERNVRYENVEKTLTEWGIVVRLRQDQRVRLTYKEPPVSKIEGISSRFEAEVEVSDFDTMQIILDKLGYTPHLVYEKYRTTYELNGVEIVLDEMPYGNFVEIEGAPQEIHKVVEHLELQNYTRYEANYVNLFHTVCKNLELDFSDLTFENFKGITVPQSAFDL